MKKPWAVISAVLSIGLSSAAGAETLRLHGATTAIDVVISPHRNAVQEATGHRLEILGNGTGKGLVDLVDRRADAALFSEPLDIAVASAALAGKTIDPAELQLHELGKHEIVFVVHPSNPVASLTWEQIRDIHTGNITNWKQIGGEDRPIRVYAGEVTEGTRAMIKKIVMGGAEYGVGVRTLTSVKRVAELVARDPQSIGGVSRGFVDADKTRVVEAQKLERPVGFVTLGEPTAEVRRVIEEFRTQMD